jgi:hypothetical protein
MYRIVITVAGILPNTFFSNIEITPVFSMICNCMGALKICTCSNNAVNISTKTPTIDFSLNKAITINNQFLQSKETNDTYKAQLFV